MPTPTRERVLELLQYQSDKGEFYWRTTRGRCAAGRRAGCAAHSGAHWRICIDGAYRFEHQLVWLIETGKWPEQTIDHRDTNGLNNRFDNLRYATKIDNAQNIRKAHVDNQSGYLGVKKQRYGFIARITVDKKTVHLGSYKTAEDAHEVYVAAKRRLHPFNTM